MSKKNITRILIANRGEIACRIIKSAHEMGIECVCVYSDADTRSLYVKRADHAVHIGPSPSVQSYLNIDKIVKIAVECEVDAVHPGYGFLSENQNLPIALSNAGVGFIGPSAYTIELMANKIRAKETAKSSGVNLIPGYIGVISTPMEAVEIANSVGFPVMLKAVSGGGGKGMRVVNSAQEMTLAFVSATKEAEKSAGDGSMFIEKYITSPRHIEMQMIADKHGNIVCLNERECSIQRKNQKVIEESPSSFMDEETRQLMMAQCVSLFKSVNYHSVGTVEFVVDANKHFYFLEVNTRLQVEHPVTELITGIDLVKEMIKIEEGQELGFTQGDIHVNGWAIEARVYAENPEKNFIPSSGRISYYREPRLSKNVRIDTGVFEGHEVTAFYDPMIAKVSTHGKNRIEAIHTMQKALEEFYISGIDENLDFLQSIFRHPEFIAGNTQTDFIDKYYKNKFQYKILTSSEVQLFSLAALFLYLKNKLLDNPISKNIDGLFTVVVNEHEKVLHCKLNNNKLTVIGNHRVFVVYERESYAHPGVLDLIVDDQEIFFKVHHGIGHYELRTRGLHARCTVYRSEISDLRKFLPTENKKKDNQNIISPISGVITAVHIKNGDAITDGQHICTIEAMKMENMVCSDQQDKIADYVCVSIGNNVKVGDVIVKLRPSISTS